MDESFKLLKMTNEVQLDCTFDVYFFIPFLKKKNQFKFVQLLNYRIFFE